MWSLKPAAVAAAVAQGREKARTVATAAAGAAGIA